MRRSIFLALLAGVALMLAGCGNKGPLYMPPATPAATPAKPATPATPAPSATVPAPAASTP